MTKDEEDFTDPEADREWLEGELAELQEEGHVKKRVTAAQINQMLQIQTVHGYGSALDLLSEHFPTLITARGRKNHEEDSRQVREVRQVGEFAPPIKVSGVGERPASEPAATAKQISYLRDLGVRDEALLTRIGKSQASELIGKVLEARDQKPNKSGCMSMLLVGMFVTIVLSVFLY